MYNHGDYKFLITSNDGEKRHVTTMLIQLGGVPVIDYWLLTAQQSKRLQALEDNLYIVANKDNIDEFEAWANDKYKKRLWCNEATKFDREYLNTLQDVAALVTEKGLDKDFTHLCIIDGNCCFSPDFNLTRIIEHSFIRDTDAITTFKMPKPTSIAGKLTNNTDKVVVHVDPNANSNPEVFAIDEAVSPSQADNIPEDSYLMGNVYYVHANSVSALVAAANNRENVSISARFAAGSMVDFFRQRIADGHKVYAHECKHVLCLNTLNQFKFADSFFKFYASQVRKAMEDQKQKHNDTNMAENFKTEFSATERKKKEMYDKYEKKLTQTNHIIPVYVVKQELARSTLDTDQIMTEFEEHYAAISSSRNSEVTLRKSGAGGAMQVQPQEKKYTLPQRFCDTSTWQHKPVKQHAVFTTTNSNYGLKAPTPQTMPSLFAGINGSFTNKFPGLYKSSGFTTAKTTPKVHKSLDDF